jgi:hypothetical protein
LFLFPKSRCDFSHWANLCGENSVIPAGYVAQSSHQEARMEKTFAEVWKDAHRERSENFVSIFSEIRALLTARRLKAKEARAVTKAYNLEPSDLAEAV